MGKYEDLQKASNATAATVIVGGLSLITTLAGAAIRAISKKAAKDKLEKDKMKKDEINELTKKLYRM